MFEGLSQEALETLEVFVRAERAFARAKVHFTVDREAGWIVIDHVTTVDGVDRRIDPPIAVSTLTE